MELEGRLNPAMSLPEVLQFLSMGKMTGTLTIKHGNYTAALVIRQGKLINSSSLGRPRKLGQMLVNRGLVPRSAVEDAAAFQKQHASQTPLGQILVQRGNITTEQLRQALRLQLEEEMWDLFGLQEGSFKFEHGDERALLTDSLVELDIEPLLLEGTRRLDEWTRIIRNIPQGDVAVPAIVSDGDHLDRDAMTFSESEWRVLSLVNGFYNIGSIANRSGVGKFETFRVINSFLASGYVVIDQEASWQPLNGNALKARQSSAANGSSEFEEPEEDMELDFGSQAAANTRAGSSPRRNGAAATAPAAAVLPSQAAGPRVFTSPAGFAAALANALLDRLMSNPDFPAGPDDNLLAEEHWRATVMNFPRADLVTARGNALDAELFERFVDYAGIEGPLKAIYEDTLEALQRFLRTLYLLAGQRLGVKAAQTLVTQLFDEFKSRSTVERSENFFFQEFAGKICA